MKIDFHIHGKLTKKVDFLGDYLLSMIEAAQKDGLTAITLTEHFNTKRFEDIYDWLDQHYTYTNDCYDISGFRVFAGMEVDVKDGGHILVTAGREAIRSMRRHLEAHVAKDCFIELANLFELIAKYDSLVIGAHPLRKSNPLAQHPLDLLKKFDAFDLNSRDLHEYGLLEMEAKVRALAAEAAIPVVAGSDAHHPLQAGAVMNEFEADCTTIAALKREIRSQRYQIQISPCLDTKVAAAEIVKPLLVEQLNAPANVHA